MLQQQLLYILTFISGTFFGSYFNLVSDRVVKNKKTSKGRSKCDHCDKTLKPKNLIPLVSYIIQKGKCNYCKKKISLYHPFSEILTGLVFAGAAYFSGVFFSANVTNIITFVYLAVVASFYVILFLTDIKYKLLPNKIVYPAIIFVFLFLVINTVVFMWLYYNQLKNDPFGIYLLQAGIFEQQVMEILRNLGLLLVSSLGIALFFWLLVFITKGRGMGFGDIRLGFLIGLFNGFPFNIIAIFLSFVLGALYSVVLVVLKKRTLKDTIAFGPFMIVSSVIALIWGPIIWSWYINLF